MADAEENFVEQPNGRQVAGPGVNQPATRAGSRVGGAIFITLWLACMFVAYVAGNVLASPPSIAEQVGGRLIEGCKTDWVGQPANEAQRAALEAQTERTIRILATQGKSNITAVTLDVPPDTAIKRIIPGIEVIGVISYEECR